MANEISDLLGNVVAELKREYRGWEISEYHPTISEEPDVTFYIDVSFDGISEVQDRGVGHPVLIAKIGAVVTWRFVDTVTFAVNHVHDIVGSLAAWGFERYVEPAIDICRSVNAEEIIEIDALTAQKRRDKVRWLVTWEFPIVTTPQIDAVGPDPVPVPGEAIDGPPVVATNLKVQART